LRCSAPIGTGNPWQQPLRDLPIAANPTIRRLDVRAVAGGKVLIQLHVAQQPGARVAALQQVMAEDTVLGEASLEGLFEDIDVIDALADEGAFLNQS
jgi:hypothetical protein